MSKEIKLPAIRANEGLSVAFQKRLDALIDEMNRSVLYWISAAYKATPPEMATDASPAIELSAIMKRLARKWNRKFSEIAPEMAEYYATAAKDRIDGALRAALKKSGFAVEFKITREINDILQATVKENVSLIKTISQEYLADVEQSVMRSVTAGRDLGGLRADIEKRFGLTKNRARLIARQSNNNATAMLKRAREQELGVTEAIWHHSHAGREPRPEHEKWNGQRYNIKTGMWSEVAQKWVWPGTDFNCLPGNSKIEFAAGCKRLWRHWYSGHLTEIITSSGKTIHATPNHPILTGRGWVAIQNVNLSDYLIRIPDHVINILYANPQGTETMFEQAFHAISIFLQPEKTAATGSEFHGDVTDRKIETITIDGFLSDEINPAICKDFCELFFTNAVKMIGTASTLKISGAVHSSLLGVFHAPDSIMRGFCAILALLRTHGSHADDIRLRLSAHLNSCFQQAITNYGSGNAIIFREPKFAQTGLVFGDNQIIGEIFNIFSRASIGWQFQAGNAEFLADQSSGNAYSIGYLADGQPIIKQLDNVVDVRQINFSGHVYNLENEVNWYSSQSYIIHNCRCTGKSIFPALIKKAA